MKQPRVDPEFENLLPRLDGDDPKFIALVESIRREGCRDPIVVWVEEGIVVDGHHRIRACAIAGAEYRIEPRSFASRAEARAWIVSTQVTRRNLSDDQVAALCALEGIDPPVYLRARGAVATARELAASPEGRDSLAWMRGIPSATLAAARNRYRRATGQATKRAPRGPSAKPPIPEGHELSGVSTLANAEGETTAAWNKTRIHGADEPPTHVPEAHQIKRTATMVRGDGTTVTQWITTAADEVKREQLMQAAWARHAEVYAGLAGTTAAPSGTEEDTCTVYPIGDPHIGLLAHASESGEHFDLGIATRELLECMRQLVDRSPPSKRAIIANLGDFLHAQDDKAETPGSGHRLDVDGRYGKVLDAAHAMLRAIIDNALLKHEVVHVRNLPGNHDPRVAVELSYWLRAVYEREPRVVVEDATRVMQYDRFGANLIGWTHGHTCKPANLPMVMATDRAEDWGDSTTHVWHTGHIHHLTRHETPGCIVESHRTLAAKDSWHAARYRSGRSLQSITYDRVHGESGRAVVGLSRVRAALLGVAS